MTGPLLVSVALDDPTQAILESATSLAKRSGAPLVAVHALAWRPLESEAQLITRIAETSARIDALLEPARAAGVEVGPPVVARQRPAELVVETACNVGAQLVITGGGAGGDTVRRWLMGSVAESIVRTSPRPVLVARNLVPDDKRPVLCPIDMSPHSREGLNTALRMAKLYGRPLVTLTVVPELETAQHFKPIEKLPNNVEAARTQLSSFLEEVDFDGVSVEQRVVVASDAVGAIIEASKQASLVIMATRSFENISRYAMGAFTERVLQASHCSALVQRVSGLASDAPDEAVRRLGRLKATALKHIAEDEPALAIPVLELLVARASGNAALHDLLADALHASGRIEEAETRRKLATYIRETLG